MPTCPVSPPTLKCSTRPAPLGGYGAIRAWAVRGVISNGETFRHRKILKQKPGFAKTEVNWLSWVVHYTYWWDDDGKITRMSLQYAN